jgi:hypothetical protein
MKRAGLAATIKARWICEQAHQQLKEKLGLDHFEGRSWQGLHRHALMTMIAYAFLQHRHLTQVGRKKESTDRRLSLACRPYATPSSISFFDHYLSNAHTAEDEAVKNSGVGKSAKVVLVLVPRLANRRAAATCFAFSRICIPSLFATNGVPHHAFTVRRCAHASRVNPRLTGKPGRFAFAKFRDLLTRGGRNALHYYADTGILP